jgi:putative nucleotidyltransferase with HDIG domain
MQSAQYDERNVQRCEHLTIDEITFEAGDLPILPQVALKMIDLTSDPKVSPQLIEKVIEMDQGATARVLTYANSSTYGLPRRICSVREAVLMLGYKSVNTLVSHDTNFNNFLGKGDRLSLIRRNLWKHSLYSGICCSVICRWLSSTDAWVVDPEEAFAAAILHDMGKMALLNVLPDEYIAAQSIAEESGLRFHEVEHDHLPYSHAVIGNAMGERWMLPDTLCDCILNHHSPLDAQTVPQLAAVVALADETSQGLAVLSLEADDGQSHSECVRDAIAILGFSPDVLSGIITACKLEMDKGINLPND